MTVRLNAMSGTLPALEGKFLVVDTLSDGYTGTFAGHYNYEVVYANDEYAIYPTLWNDKKKRFIRSDEMVVYTKGTEIFYVDRTTSDPYNPPVIETLIIEEGMDRDKRTLQAFKQFADSFFRIGNYNLFIAGGVSEADSPNFVFVESVELDKNSGSATLGDTVTLVATVLPEDADVKDVTFSISDPTVGKLTQTNNKLEVLTTKIGTATITVETVDGNHTDTYELTVVSAKVAVTGITFDQTVLGLNVGEEATLTATVLPENASDKTYTLAVTEGAEAVTLSGNKASAVGAGEATVTATTKDGGFTATCKITVTEPEA